MHRHRIILVTSLFFFLVIHASSAFSYQQIEFIRELGDYKKPAGQRLMNGPRSLALFGDKIYIADTEANRIIVLDQSGKTLLSWGSKGEKPGQFKSPSGIALDEQGRVYVSDSGNGRVQIFDGEGKFIRAFGSKGSGPKQFSGAGGIAASRGLVYVADTGNSRVQALTADGVFMAQISVQTKKDEMKAPVAVAVDVQNRIYALEAGNKVRIFDASGVQTGAFGVKGKGTEGFNGPQDLAVDDRGNIYVSDSGNFKIKKFDQQGRLLGSIGSEGAGPGQFRKATGVDVDRDGKVYVLDSGKNTLQILACEAGDAPLLSPASPLPSVEMLNDFSRGVNALAMDKRLWGLSGDSLSAVGVIAGRKIGSTGSEPGQLKNPAGFAIDGRGNFWVSDTGNDRVQKFSLEGNLLQVVGKTGAGEGEFHAPSAVAVSPRGNIFVADTGNKRIQVFSAKGMFLGMFGKPGRLAGQFWEPLDLAVDSSEIVYVVDRGNVRISKYDSTGTLLWEAGRAGRQDGEFKAPRNILVSPDDEVYVLDSDNARVQVFSSQGKFLRKFGSEGKGPGEFRSPAGLALEGGVRLYVGDRGNSRVQVLGLKQTPAVPADVTAQARVNEIQLSWKPNSETYLEQYRLYRADAPQGPFKLIGTTAEPFYIDRNLPSNRSFHYRLSSLAGGGNESALSATASAATPRLVPSPPKKAGIDPSEKQITLAWLPNTEPFVDHYRLYRTKQLAAGFELLTKSDKTVFVDSPLADDTLYYYQLTAVGKEGDESQPSEVSFASTPKASLTVPPLEIGKVELSEAFASAYKYYETHPLGKVTIKNNTEKAYPKVKLRFSIKEFMDYPTELEIESVPPKREMSFELKPVFSNKILDVTENTTLQSELSLTYHVAGEPRTVARSFPVTLYERHAMTWDKTAKIGAFVTPKDPVVADFSRSVIQPYVDAYPNLHQTLVYARAVYAALGVYGLTYIIDPTSPYQEFSENAARVDYLQYPRDTLARKSGDCDDLSILFAASMENIGVATALVDVPGHVFILFNTGVPEKERATLGFASSLLVPHQGTVWIPVEMTLVGSSFTKAWYKGAEEYRDWSAKGKAEVMEIQKAWEQFKPATLAKGDGKPVRVKREEIEAKFKGELETLGRQRLATLSAEYLEALKKNPNDSTALTQLGILYGENGLHTEALEQFQKMLALDKNNPVALNNIGNINYLQDRLEDARLAYEAALKAVPGDSGIMANLARVLFQTGKVNEARKLFRDAAEIDPRVLRQYGDLAASLGIGK
ncbi:MAG: 6-bladed beta-propeller [Nitrospirota bacterium]